MRLPRSPWTWLLASIAAQAVAWVGFNVVASGGHGPTPWLPLEHERIATCALLGAAAVVATSASLAAFRGFALGRGRAVWLGLPAAATTTFPALALAYVLLAFTGWI